MREALNSEENAVQRRPSLQPLSCQQNSSYSAPETRRLSPSQSHSQSLRGASGKEVPKVNRNRKLDVAHRGTREEQCQERTPLHCVAGPLQFNGGRTFCDVDTALSSFCWQRRGLPAATYVTGRFPNFRQQAWPSFRQQAWSNLRQQTWPSFRQQER